MDICELVIVQVSWGQQLGRHGSSFDRRESPKHVERIATGDEALSQNCLFPKRTKGKICAAILVFYRDL